MKLKYIAILFGVLAVSFYFLSNEKVNVSESLETTAMIPKKSPTREVHQPMNETKLGPQLDANLPESKKLPIALMKQLKEAASLFPQLSKSYGDANVDAVFKVGKALERAKVEPSLDPKSFKPVGDFYISCLQSSDAPASLRAVCWKRLESLSKQFPYDISRVRAQVPAGIDRLAGYLPDE